MYDGALVELTAENTAAWLIRRGIPAAGCKFSDLGGGISNQVILAECPARRAVVKQSLGKLRVEREWLSDRNRIFREAAAMRWLEGRVRGGRIPRLVFEDRETFAIVMEAAPADARMWKSLLFKGELDSAAAGAAGSILGSIIAGSWQNAEAEHLFGDQTVFEQLRIDPYYRFTAASRPESALYINALIERSSVRRVSLTHGDWSPKNLLCGRDGMWAIDWEVIHFGDPSFDAGFLLNHLFLKSIAMPDRKSRFETLSHEFLQALRLQLPDEARWVPDAALEHLPALMLARVDGKSPAEYLDTGMRERVRAVALDLMARPATSLAGVYGR